jgi:hypothetical protein
MVEFFNGVAGALDSHVTVAFLTDESRGITYLESETARDCRNRTHF